MTKVRTFKVWIKGKRITTERTIQTGLKAEAIWLFAKIYNVKTIHCDARLVRKGEES